MTLINNTTGLEIAVVGLSCRFPGASNEHEFWQNLKEGKETVTFFSEEELREKGVDENLLKDPNFVKVRGILKDIDCFDSKFFNYTSVEAEIMDPQIRIFHELVWEALENAGLKIINSKEAIGLYAGATRNRTWELLNVLTDKVDRVGAFALNHLIDRDFLTTRVAHKLNFQGPALTIKTACSTGLVAVDAGCRGLLTSQCDIAVAGSVSYAYTEDHGYLYREGMVFSPDGHCRAFDENGRGVVFADGAGVVVLKRLEDALRDNDNIRAIIKGSATNNDGNRRSVYESPCADGQYEVIKKALYMAEVDPETISYVETHGTGTVIGDPIEIEGLKRAFNTNKRKFCAIGSVKTNIGHTDSAAGMAGFIKTILSMENGLIPPNLHFKSPNKKIKFEETPFYVNTKLSDWKSNVFPTRAGVSSFGIGGTNAHVILEKAQIERLNLATTSVKPLIFSAKDNKSLDKVLTSFKQFLENTDDSNNLDCISYTLTTGREYFNLRCSITASHTNEAIEKLSKIIENGHEKRHSNVYRTVGQKNKCVFMFTGQGSQYVDMGLDLYQNEPIFKREFDKCISVINDLFNEDLYQIIYPSYSESRNNASDIINKTQFTQPLLFSFEYALAKLLSSFGVEPDAMIGHSLGEYVAATLAEVFTLSDALKIVAYRGKLMGNRPTGKMISVLMSIDDTKEYLDSYQNIAVAAVNFQGSVVLSGNFEDINALSAVLEDKGVQYRVLRTSHAYHSNMMDDILEDFHKQLSTIQLNTPKNPFVSNVTGDWITEIQATSPSYWTKHLRETVNFQKGVETLINDNHAIYLEVGPGRTLSTFVKKQLIQKELNFALLNLVGNADDNNNDQSVFVEAVCELWNIGYGIDFENYYKSKNVKKVVLPTYPFEKNKFWIDKKLTDLRNGFQQKNKLVKNPNIDNWFYIPSWERSLLFNRNKKSENTEFIVFSNDSLLSTQILNNLSLCENSKVFTVVPDSRFNIIEKNKFGINPKEYDEFVKLFQSIKGSLKSDVKILLVWDIETQFEEYASVEEVNNAVDYFFYSPIYIAKAAFKELTDINISFTVISHGIFEVSGNEKLNPFKALYLGPVLVIPKEYKQFVCKIIDTEYEQISKPGYIEDIINEIEDDRTDVKVAFRNGNRYVETFIQDSAISSNKKEVPFKDGATYLITGGTGGIGFELARIITTHCDCNLILISRSNVPGIEEINNNFKERGIIDKALKLDSLKRINTNVVQIAADVSDYSEMKGIINSLLERYGEINGVIHAAGVPGGGVIELKTKEVSDKVLSPKVTGLWVLSNLLKECDLDFFTLFSSINSIIPRVGQVDYFSANAFLDSYAYHSRRDHKINTTSINWDAWSEVGMALNSIVNNRDYNDPVKFFTIDHPFVNNAIEDKNRFIFSSILSRKKDWIIKEHRHQGTDTGLVPGVSYVEMIYAATKSLIGNKFDIEIFDVFFLNPLLIGNDEERSVQLCVEKRDGIYEVEIYNEDLHKHQKYTIGKAKPLDKNGDRFHDLNKILEKCSISDYIIKPTDTSKVNRGLLFFGPRWQNIKRIRVGTDIAIANIELAEEFHEDINSFYLHPALFDTAAGFPILNSITGFLFGPKQSIGYIPFSYKSLKIKHPLPSKFYSIARILKYENTQADAESIILDVDIVDESGKELLTIEQYTLVKINEGLGNKISSIGDYNSNPVFLTDNVKLREGLQFGISNAEGGDAFNRIFAIKNPQVIITPVDLKISQEQSRNKDDYDELDSQQVEDEVTSKNDRPDIDIQYVDPSSEMEIKVAEIWQQILGIKEIGLDDDFFQLGGDSLNIVQLNAKLKKLFKRDIPIANLFKYQTIRLFLEYIEGGSASKKTTAEKQIIRKAEYKEYYRLSSVQQRLFILQEIENTSTAYNVPLTIEIFGEIKLQDIKTCVKRVVDRHAVLRSKIVIRDSIPVQQFLDKIDIDIDVFERVDNIDEEIGAFIKPFDLRNAPLFRIGYFTSIDNKQVIVLDFHHIIADGLSVKVFLDEFIQVFYKKELRPVEYQYKDYLEWERKYLKSDQLVSQEQYWKKKFENNSLTLSLPSDFSRPVKQSFKGDSIYFTIDGHKFQMLKQLGSEESVTAFMILYSVYSLMLSKISGNDEINVGTPVLGRKLSDFHQLMGVFVNTVVLKSKIENDESFKKYLLRTKDVIIEALNHQDYPYEMLVKSLSLDIDLSRNPLFDVMFVFLNESIHAEQVDFGKDNVPAIKQYNINRPYSRFDLTLEVIEEKNNITCRMEYCSDLFQSSTIQRFVQYYQSVLDVILENQDITIKEISLMSEKERNTMVSVLNKPYEKIKNKHSISKLIDEQSNKSPERVAIYTKQENLSYLQLEEISNKIANLIDNNLSINDNNIIGVLLPRDKMLIPSLLGILKVGSAYLPMDINFPVARIQELISESSAKYILTCRDLINDQADFKLDVNYIFIEDFIAFDTVCTKVIDFQIESLAYLIFTSGSTGKPKGVPINQLNLINFFEGIREIIGLSENDKILALTTVSFDISFLELIAPLMVGASIYLTNEEEQKHPDSLLNLIRDNHITIVQITPERLRLLLNCSNPEIKFKCVRKILVGGEMFPEELLDTLNRLGNTETYNMYGPTETTIWSTIKKIDKQSKVTIGRPLLNTRVYITDKNFHLQPIGIPGELCIAGLGVSKGYLKDNELTNEKYVKDIFYGEGMVYKTGDLARWNEQGEIEFIGRIDSQIKLRGYRIEPKEIEIKLAKCKGIKQVHVLLNTNKSGQKHLIAFYTSIVEFKESELTNFLREKLPSYMIPTYFVRVNEIPLNNSGKVDTRLLKFSRTEGEKKIMLGSEIENILFRYWKEVLGDIEIDVHDNFFDIGGSSNSLMKLSAKIEEQFEMEDLVLNLFRFPTIYSFGKYVNEAHVKKDISETIERGLETKRKRLTARTKKEI